MDAKTVEGYYFGRPLGKGMIHNMGSKLLWTAVAIFLIAPVVRVPAADVVAAVFALIGIVLVWLDR